MKMKSVSVRRTLHCVRFLMCAGNGIKKIAKVYFEFTLKNYTAIRKF